MERVNAKLRAQAVITKALDALVVIGSEKEDEEVLQLVMAVSAICGAFSDGWIAELLPPIHKIVSKKYPELAQAIVEARKRRKHEL